MGTASVFKIGLHMNQLSLEQLNLVVMSNFFMARRNHNINVSISAITTGNGLTIQTYNCSLTAYNSEQTIKGRAIRLFIYLNDNHSLMTILRKYNLNKVMITEAHDIQLFDKSNSAFFCLEYIEELLLIISELRLKTKEVAENGIKLIIANL
jgi:hypothetical protein